MSRRQNSLHLFATFVVCSVLSAADYSRAQHQGYSDFYNQNRKVVGQNVGTNAHLYNKYFYHSPGVSPYMNLGRHGSDAAESYQLYVRPELERREASRVAQGKYVQQRKLQGNVGHTQYPGALTNGGAANAYRVPTSNAARTPAYHNHWYGGWNKR
jgi:hypothetical protein